MCPTSAALVLGVLPLTATTARRQSVVRVVEVHGPPTVGAAVPSDAWFLSDVVGHVFFHLPSLVESLVEQVFDTTWFHELGEACNCHGKAQYY